jgi:hypothetical protein
MSIVARFPTTGVTKQQYDTVKAALTEAGEWPPDGCLVHVCFGEEQSIHISEIWESPDKMAAFGEKLQPRLAAAGIDLSGEPEIFETLNLETF